MVSNRDEKRPSWDVSEGCMNPLVQVRESEDEVVITADLPCVDKDDVDIRIEKDALYLSAEMKRDFQFENWGGFHRKVKFNSFRKSIPLPSEVDSDSAEATFRNNILKIRIKKRQGKQIEIK